MNEEVKHIERVIGFDAHPDSFTAAILRGPTPAAAVVEKVFNKLPMAQLPSWAQKHTTAQDMIVLEASGNSFHYGAHAGRCRAPGQGPGELPDG